MWERGSNPPWPPKKGTGPLGFVISLSGCEAKGERWAYKLSALKHQKKDSDSSSHALFMCPCFFLSTFLGGAFLHGEALT